MQSKRYGMVTGFLLLFALLLFPSVDAHAVTKQTYANVVIFAYFKEGTAADYDEDYGTGLRDEEYYQNTEIKKDFMKMYDGPEEYSVTNYLDKISDGNLEIKNIYPQMKNGVIEPYCIENTKLSEVMSGNKDETIIKEIMDHVTLPSDQIYDYNGDGCIDNVSIILRGGGKGVQSTNGKGVPSMYAHKADYGSTESWGTTTKRVSAYNMLNTYSILGSRSGVLVHEFLHTAGFPDLYTIEGDTDPVYCWDIMGLSARYPSNMLMYMRMKIGKWLDESEIPVIDSSKQNVTLDATEQSEGRRAYIIKSPLNNEEFFVVEFRKRPTTRTIDYYIGDSGLIVYRINPTIENLTNHGKDGLGVYVFRPQSGSGYVADNSRATVCNAYLSAESGRTSMGTADMSKKLEDGAIAFSNGNNSGIQISNVSSAKGDQITFDITVPAEEDYDVWEDTKFTDSANSSDYSKQTAIRTWNGIPYMAVRRNNKISLWKYSDDVWTQVGSDIINNDIENLQLAVFQDDLYLAYHAYESDQEKVIVKKMKPGSTGWISVSSVMGNSASMKVLGDALYMTYLVPDQSGFNSVATLARISDSSITKVVEYQQGFIGTPNLAYANDRIYLSARSASGPIYIYQYDKGQLSKVEYSTFEMNTNDKANTYDMAGNGKNLYVTLGGSQAEMKLYCYDGSQWECKTSGKECFQPKMSVSQGNLYVLLMPGSKGSIQVVRYDDEGWIEEGIDIDGSPLNIDFTAINRRLLVSYVRESDQKIFVKKKESTAPEQPETTTEKTPETTTGKTPETTTGKTPETTTGKTPETTTGKIPETTTGKTPETTTTKNPETTTTKNPSATTQQSAATTTTKKPSATAAASVVRLTTTKYVYSGLARTPGVIVKNKSGKVLKKNTDYTVVYPSGRKNVGSYTVIITLKGKYRGQYKRSFVIQPKGTALKKLKAKKKKLMVLWKQQRQQTTGYQIQYAKVSSFSNAKNITIQNNKVSKKMITGLASKKRYYVRIRTYKKIGTKTYVSSWSLVKKGKVK